ncbi:ankyrin repeat domain-containing protein [Actimicrobium sp. CCI2.3]|uniref:ankyrin repeat domain-containing protein n=1 Tax=Actimicrobium sp. CCI2.3 TaxID=3048616 RepID=UPI002AB58635|nr:ankyrin repeat domain-containing protein [Actimicrobium sp. CCI2.3]MDY7575644.1 ankyrin repeat domain-containing protein [Actimicrobium sp. CCI2.3]MEB0021985.1 ankyrin repeat domain-containing protein [Actimicrobium sp. CCI2.3]
MQPYSPLSRTQNTYLPHSAHDQSGRISDAHFLPGAVEVQTRASYLPRTVPAPRGTAMAAGLRSQLSMTSEPDYLLDISMADEAELHRMLDTFCADINRSSADGTTLLMTTVRKNNLPEMQVLLEWPELDVNLTDQQGNTALHMAAQAGQIDHLDALLGDARVDPHVRNRHGNTALCLAAQHDQYQVVERLLNHQLLNLSIPENAADEYNKTYRLAADQHGFNTVFTLLDSKPWLMNAVRSDGHTALTSAIKAGRIDVVKALLQHYPELNVNLAGEGLGTALNVAAGQHNAEMVLTLLRHPGLDPNSPVDHSGSTVLHLAAARGDANIVQALMSALPVINVNAEAACRDTPLHRAAYFGQLDTLRMLATRVDDINQRNKEGLSVMHFVAGSGNMEAVKFLQQLPGIDPLVFSDIGQYPSDIAQQSGHADAARVLQEAEFQSYVRSTES